MDQFFDFSQCADAPEVRLQSNTSATSTPHDVPDHPSSHPAPEGANFFPMMWQPSWDAQPPESDDLRFSAPPTMSSSDYILGPGTSSIFGALGQPNRAESALSQTDTTSLMSNLARVAGDGQQPWPQSLLQLNDPARLPESWGPAPAQHPSTLDRPTPYHAAQLPTNRDRPGFIFGQAMRRPQVPVIESSSRRSGQPAAGTTIDDILSSIDAEETNWGGNSAELFMLALRVVQAAAASDQQAASLHGLIESLLCANPIAKGMLIRAQEHHDAHPGVPITDESLRVASRVLQNDEIAALVRKIRFADVPIPSPFTRQIRSFRNNPHILAVKPSSEPVYLFADLRPLEALCEQHYRKPYSEVNISEKINVAKRLRKFIQVDAHYEPLPPGYEPIVLDPAHFPIAYSAPLDKGISRVLRVVDLCNVATRSEAYKCFIFHTFPNGQCPSCPFHYFNKDLERIEGQDHPQSNLKGDPLKKPVEMRRHLVDYQHSVAEFPVLTRISQILLDWDQELKILVNENNLMYPARKRPAVEASGRRKKRARLGSFDRINSAILHNPSCSTVKVEASSNTTVIS